MNVILHGAAVVFAALGVALLVGERDRSRAPEVIASAIMVVAMLDIVTVRAIPVVAWTGILLAGAMALAAGRGRARRAGRPYVSVPMVVHTALGMIVMAGVQLSMVGAVDPVAISAHAHGGAASASFELVCLAGVAVYAGYSAVLAFASASGMKRMQVLAMAFSVAAMAAGLIS